jgi:chaperonin GroES
LAKMRPLHNRVLVKRDPVTNTSAGGILLPTDKDDWRTGTVVALGPGRVSKIGTLIPIDLVVGDKVLFGRYAGTDIASEGEELTLLFDEDIWSVSE